MPHESDDFDQHFFVFYSCQKAYLYQSSLKKHFMISHVTEYKRYLAEKKSKSLIQTKEIETKAVLLTRANL